MQYTINARVPICPRCNAKLKFSQKYFAYYCWDCKTQFMIEDKGQTEHEFICVTLPTRIFR